MATVHIKLNDVQRAYLVNVVLGQVKCQTIRDSRQLNRIMDALDADTVDKGGSTDQIRSPGKQFVLDDADFDFVWDELRKYDVKGSAPSGGVMGIHVRLMVPVFDMFEATYKIREAEKQVAADLAKSAKAEQSA